jgi:lysyl-tRNA synthetase class 2
VSGTLATVANEFQNEIVDSGRLSAFLFFVALLGTFGFIRTSTWMIHNQVSWWPGNVSVGGTHVHHLVWGIFAMMIFGYIGVVVQPESPWREIVTVLFAFGMGLTLDEFALWLELKDVYWEKEGRKSVDAMIIAACVAGLLVVGVSSWVELADTVGNEVVAALGVAGVAGIAVALVNASKERFIWALVSLLIWPLGLIGALRMAKPNSLWAKRLYSREKRELAAVRYGIAVAGESGPEPAASDSSPSAAGQSSS